MSRRRKESLYMMDGETMTPEGGHLKAVHPVIGEVDDKSNTGALFVEGKDGSLTLLRDDQETVRDKQGRLRLKPSTKKSPGPLVHRIRSSKAPDHTGRLIPSRRYRIANKKFGTLQSRLQVADVIDERAAQSWWWAANDGQEELEERLISMENGQFFIRHSREMPTRALLLIHKVMGVDQSWLLVVDDNGVGLKRSRHRFGTLYEFVMFYARHEQPDLDIPLNLGHKKKKVRRIPPPPPRPRSVRVIKKRRPQRPEPVEEKDDWRTIRTFEYGGDDNMPTPPPFPYYPYPQQFSAPVIHVHIDNSGCGGGSGVSVGGSATATTAYAATPGPATGGYVEEAKTISTTTYSYENDDTDGAVAPPQPPVHSSSPSRTASWGEPAPSPARNAPSWRESTQTAQQPHYPPSTWSPSHSGHYATHAQPPSAWDPYLASAETQNTWDTRKQVRSQTYSYQ